MLTLQRNMDAGLGYGTNPDQVFAAAGLSKTGTYDGTGTPVEVFQNANPAVETTQNEISEEPTLQQQPSISEQPAPVQTNEFNLNGRFGDRFKSFEELESYVSEVEAKASKDPFANDLVRNLNKAIQEGVDPELYMAVSQLNVEELSGREALILEMQWKKGLSFEDAEFLVNRTYKLEGEEDELDMSDPEVREAQIRLGVDAQEAKEFLSQYKQEALTSPYERQQQELTQAWTPVIPKVVDSWKSFQVNSKAGSFTIPATDGAIKAATTLLQEVINNGLLDNMPDQEGLAIANAIVEKEIMKHDFQHAIDYVAESLKNKQLEEKHNIRKPSGQSGSPKPSGDDALIDFLKKVRY